MAVLFNEVHTREWAWRQQRIDAFRSLLGKAGLDEQVYVDAVHLAGGGTNPVHDEAEVRRRLRDRDASLLGQLAQIYHELLHDYEHPELRDPWLRDVARSVVGSVDLVRWIRVGNPPDEEFLVLLRSQVAKGRPADADLTEEEELFVRVVGRLRDQRQLDQGRRPTRQEIRSAQGWVEDHDELFDVALPPIRNIVLTRNAVDRVYEAHWSNAVARITKDGITADDAYIRQIVEESMMPFLGLSAAASGGPASPNGVTGSFGGARPSWIDIRLPDLEAEAALDIVEDNLKAMQAIYFAATLEDLRFFQVMDKLVELFNVGVLPFGRGAAGDKIYGYWKRNFDRFTEVERHNLYARALGRPGGDVGMGSPNRQFHDLWLRFISSVSEWRRQVAVDSLLRDGTPYGVSMQQVRKSARDLASNLSLFGYGIAYFAATELQQQVRDILAILSDNEVKSAYGARDVWQVIDQVATLELGGARNSVRYRTMANSGAVIIRWLAQNAETISSTGYGPILQPSDLEAPTARLNRNPVEDPTNFDLIEACEQYLAVTGTSDARVEEYSQPALGPEHTSRPIQIPGIARDVFESVGVSPGDYGLN